jgi:hypothetical protein
MRPEPIYKERLLKLAEHLEHGQLEHVMFYFGSWNANQSLKSLSTNGCGYAGCAIGECPIAFPDSWKWLHGKPTLKENEDSLPERDAATFFGLNHIEFGHLFIPDDQSPERYGGIELSNSATKEQVASNIRIFVNSVEANRLVQ